jgi:hypothetical protein
MVATSELLALADPNKLCLSLSLRSLQSLTYSQMLSVELSAQAVMDDITFGKDEYMGDEPK